MRRSVVVTLVLALGLSVPAAADAANQQGRVAPKKKNKKAKQKGRARVQPLGGGDIRPDRSLGGTRRAAEPQYDEGYEDDVDDQEYEPAPAIALGHAPGRRTSYRPNGMMAPAAPGYNGAPNYASWNGAKGPLTTVGAIVVGTITVGVLAVAGTVFAATLGHNLPQLLGSLFGGG